LRQKLQDSLNVADLLIGRLMPEHSFQASRVLILFRRGPAGARVDEALHHFHVTAGPSRRNNSEKARCFSLRF
jgi:hypothetical protein